jgi:hypothetical protein
MVGADAIGFREVGVVGLKYMMSTQAERLRQRVEMPVLRINVKDF